MLIRFVINLLMKKLNVVKALKNSKVVLRLGLGCGAFNVLFHLIRRYFALRRKNAIADSKQPSSVLLSQEVELFSACAIASLGLHFAPANDIRILKVVIFSRAVTSLVTYFGDATGYFKPIEAQEKRKFTVEYFLAVACCIFIVYAYIFHPKSMSPSLTRTITRGLHLDDNEKRLFDCLRAMAELEPKILPKGAMGVRRHYI